MGTGGIIFVAILALWGLYLVPVLVKERAARLDHRGGDHSSGAVRVLHRPAAQRPSRRVVLTADRPLVSDDLPARPTRDLAEALRRDARRTRLGVRVRAWAALLGAAALLVTAGSALAGTMPVWAPAVAGAWLTGVLVTGAAVAGVRRRATAAPVRVRALPPRAHRVATEVFDDRATRPAAPRTQVAEPPALPAVAGGTEAARPEHAAETWTPVEVPGPVYASKPASHRPPALPWSMPATAEVLTPASQERPQDAPADVPAADGTIGPAEVDLRGLDTPAEQPRSATG
ncbi:hypothetical protein [Aquipuribacter sp. MA13-6]|uniref:hypothetical protein n=1 Tax=unclassified Aquipuribacter TaxID=2635084 RepID=UPI003EED65A4